MNRRKASLVVALGFAGLGLAVLLRPGLLAERFMTIGQDASAFRQATYSLSIAVAVNLIVWALVPFLELKAPSALRRWISIVASSLCFVALVQPLANWMIDDAAITFAYSENLVRGYGITLHPNLAPEEGYSNTLWMLWLAGLRLAGISIPVAAKISCIVIGVITCATLHLAVDRLHELAPKSDHSVDGYRAFHSRLLGSAILFGAPYIVWSVSGLEHGLQGLLLLLSSAMPILAARYVWPTALALVALTLVRPEAPLIVAGCFATHVLLERKQLGLRKAILVHLPVAGVPALAWLGLTGFRIAYFGDPMPNPYYAKAADATFIRLLNLVGGGWDYVFSWAYGSAVLLLVPVLALALVRPQLPKAIVLAFTQLATQGAFVIYANGDWMGCWRFVAALLPTLAMIGAWAFDASRASLAAAPKRGGLLAQAQLAVAMLLLSMGTAKQYLTFLVNPTTPFRTVAHIGERFVELGHELGVAEPILAHHDAGGTSYSARIQLLDLGGLGNRTIAKHIHDAEFLRHHILDVVAPDFVFGVADNFAAGSSRFWDTPAFATRYVAVEFPNDPLMRSDLCHMRRDLLERIPLPPGIEVVLSSGTALKVVVN